MREKETKGYHKLFVWQKARELVKIAYQSTNSFPSSEEFGLKGQIRRAVISVVLTIVEGYRRHTRKDYLHFLNIAEGSLVELEAAFEIALDLEYLSHGTFELLENKRSEVHFLLVRLIQSLKEKK